MKMKTHPIKLDLEIRSLSSFQTLVDVFNQSNELAEMYPPDTIHKDWSTNIRFSLSCKPDECIAHYNELIMSLSGEAKVQWNMAYHKCFNLVYNTSIEEPAFTETLSALSIKKLAELDASFAFRLYPIEMIDHDESQHTHNKKANLMKLAGF
ncbi:hypothetical protein HQQ94_08585 [Shewanella sp. VB17]|uniref:hypothetical protein n=1 Tax=Shewanella sp. VB17 TaxID=2739432 RepID=UPI001567648F|nr:hypothetical protein [Shewanella sp. VB17]NRD73298.1 hypothetical protein [Shewanella sp. VB17]